MVVLAADFLKAASVDSKLLSALALPDPVPFATTKVLLVVVLAVPLHPPS